MSPNCDLWLRWTLHLAVNNFLYPWPFWMIKRILNMITNMKRYWNWKHVEWITEIVWDFSHICGTLLWSGVFFTQKWGKAWNKMNKKIRKKIFRLQCRVAIPNTWNCLMYLIKGHPSSLPGRFKATCWNSHWQIVSYKV